MGQARLRLRRQQGWQREQLWPRLEGQCKTQRVLQRVQREGQVLQQRKLLRRQARLQVQWCWHVEARRRQLLRRRLTQ